LKTLLADGISFKLQFCQYVTLLKFSTLLKLLNSFAGINQTDQRKVQFKKDLEYISGSEN